MKQLVFASLVCLLLVGCSFKNSPKYVSKDYTQALQEKDFRRAKSYVYVPRSAQSVISAQDIDKKLQQHFDGLQKELESIGGVKDFKITEKREVSDNIVELVVECIGNNGTIIDKNFYMIKLDDKWKIIQSL